MAKQTLSAYMMPVIPLFFSSLFYFCDHKYQKQTEGFIERHS